MILTPAQKEIARDTHRFRVVNCGRRFGKTRLSAWEMLGVAASKANRRVAYYAPTRDDARDIMWNELVAICEPLTIYKNESRLELRLRTQDGGTSGIHLYGWEAVRERGKGRGVKNDFIVADEVAMYSGFWEGWHEVLRPTLTDTRGGAMFPSTPKGFNHFYDLARLEHEDEDFKTFHFTTYDNPHIPVDEIEKAKKEITEDRFAQEYLADFRKKEGLVYPEFNRQRHIFTDVTYNKAQTIAGIDFGFTNPSVILVIDVDHDNNYWVRHEWYKTGKTNQELIEVAKTFGINIFYPDPAEPDRIEEMNRAGLNVREVSKDIEKGIDSVRTLFKNNKIKIHASCLNLISELETYSYPDKTHDRNETETPIKEKDHAMDALRYALHMTIPVYVEEEMFPLYGTSYR